MGSCGGGGEKLFAVEGERGDNGVSTEEASEGISWNWGTGRSDRRAGRAARVVGISRAKA